LAYLRGNDRSDGKVNDKSENRIPAGEDKQGRQIPRFWLRQNDGLGLAQG
jgi:hypothetical protein